MLRASLPAVLVFLAGCHQIEPPPPPLHPRSSGTQSAEMHDDHDHAAGKTATPGAIAPRVAVEQVEPGQEALAQAILTASKPSMNDCRANSGGGLIRLRIVSDKSRARITVDPDSSVSAAMRHCVIEALSTIDVPDTLSQSSPSMRSSAGFASTFTVAW